MLLYIYRLQSSELLTLYNKLRTCHINKNIENTFSGAYISNFSKVLLTLLGELILQNMIILYMHEL